MITDLFTDTTLPDHEAAEVVAHLEVCETCLRKLNELEFFPKQPMLAALRELQNEPITADDPPLSRKIGQYEILEKIAQGGMGVVYRAIHPHLKREVALKVIRDSRLDDPSARERFIQEMQSLGKLTHPNIVHATDAGIDGDTPFIVTELLDGQDFGSYIEEHGQMPVKQAVDCIQQAATGLAYAHKAGYVHRDIKPSNLFLTRGGNVKILDLGIARPLADNAGEGRTVSGHVVGSPEYMAPERFHGGTVDARSDIYSLGQTFVCLLTGKAGSNEKIPSTLKPILARMTAGLPSERFQTADELVRALTSATKNSNLILYTTVCTAALIAVLAVVGYMLIPSTSVPVVAPLPKSIAVETVAEPKIEPLGESPTAAKQESLRDLSPPHFDITRQTGWDVFFEAIVDCCVATKFDYSFNEKFTPFTLLYRMGRGADAERLLSLQLSQLLPDDPLPQTQDRIKYFDEVADWENAVGNKGKSDEYRTRIEELIAAEPSDLKRDRLNLYYENRKKREKRIPPVFIVGKELVDAIDQGEPSVKDLCDRGQYREAVLQYLTNTKDSIFLGTHIGQPYNGYGESYVVSRMIEKGDFDGAEKLRQDANCTATMYFRMGCFLAVGHLKAGRKNETQTVWNDSIEKLTDRFNQLAPEMRILYLDILLESIIDSGLYEYVRAERVENLRRMSENRKSSDRFKRELSDYKKAKAEWEKTGKGKPPAMPDLPDILPPVD